MSRRPPNPAAERAAQNQQTIKNLLKLEPNKVCADCKRNKRESAVVGRQVPLAMLTISFCRSTVGELESRRLRLHPVLWHPPWNGHSHQPRQICRPGLLDRRAAPEHPQLGKCACEQVLGGEAGAWPRALGGEDRELHSYQI